MVSKVKRFIAKVRELCQRRKSRGVNISSAVDEFLAQPVSLRHGDRRPKFEAQVKALGEIATRRYGAKHG